MIAKLGKELPERVELLVNRSLSAVIKVAIVQLKATTKKHSHANKRGKHFYFYFSLSF